MAKLTRHVEMIEKVKGYTLELDEEELRMIFSLVGSVTGIPDYTFRNISDRIYNQILKDNNWTVDDFTRVRMVVGSVKGITRNAL
jgi:hypothetical protein